MDQWLTISLLHNLLTLGTNTRQRVRVVQKMIKTEMRMKKMFLWSFRTAVMATPRTHMIMTLYTDIPTY